MIDIVKSTPFYISASSVDVVKDGGIVNHAMQLFELCVHNQLNCESDDCQEINQDVLNLFLDILSDWAEFKYGHHSNEHRSALACSSVREACKLVEALTL